MENLPCYANLVAVLAYNVDTPKKAENFISRSLKSWGKKGMVIFSVTEKDVYKGECVVDVFLKAAMTFKNAGYTSCITKYHGNYRCYLVVVPCPEEVK